MARRPGLRLELFGGPSLRRDGLHIGASPFQSALLAVVLGEGRDRLSRAFVHRLLWEDAHRHVVHHRFSQLVYLTNRRCGDRVLALDGEFVRVRAGTITCDLDDFEEMLRVPRFDKACALLRRGFLSAFPTRRTRAMSGWIEERQVTVRAKLRRRALATWEFAERSGEWSHARDAAEALLHLEPRDETVLRRVMRATALGGMVREAEAVYQAFADHARPSGEWVPERETAALLRSVQSAVRVSEAATEAAPPLETDAPFLGRAEELAHLTRSIYGREAGDRMRVVLVGGEAGIGKTRLVEEAIQGARFRGYRVLRATATEMERATPLSPLLKACDQPWTGPLLRTVEEPWRSALLALMPRFGGETVSPTETATSTPAPTTPIPPTPKAAAKLVGEAFLHLFKAVARERRTIFFLDDLHWADPATVAVLRLVHRRWHPDRFTLVLAYRPEELREHDSAFQLVPDLEVDPRPTAVRLGPLAPEPARRVAAAVPPQQPTETTLDKIVALAGGNPFFLIELAEEWGTGTVPVPSQAVLPTSAPQLIRQRLARLDPAVARVAAALAVCGRTVTLGHLCRIATTSRVECVGALETLRRLRFVRWTQDGVRIRDEIVRKTVYDDLDPVPRSLLHSATAEMLRSLPQSPLDQVAMHLSRAGESPPDDDHEAERSTDLMRLLRLAFDDGERPSSRPAAVRLARTHFDSQELAKANRAGEEALETAEELAGAEQVEMRLLVAVARWRLGTDPPRTTLATLAKVEQAALEEHYETLAVRAMDAALEVLETPNAAETPTATRSPEEEAADLVARVHGMIECAEPTARCRAMALLAVAQVRESPSEALAWSRRAVSLVRDKEMPAEEMLACRRHVEVLASNGLLASAEGRGAVAEAGAAAMRTRDTRSRALFLFQMADWHAVAGTPEAAAGIIADYRTAIGSTDCPGLLFLDRFGHGAAALARGDPSEAAGAFAEAREMPTHCVSRRTLARLDGLEGRALLDLGRIRDAGKLARRAPVSTGAPGDLYAFHARYLSRLGGAGRAVALLDKGLAETRTTRPVSWLRLALELARLARRSGRPRTELAREARAKAETLELPGLAHEFVPYV